MRPADCLDPAPLLEWIDRHPEIIEAWPAKKYDDLGLAYRRIVAMRAGSWVSFDMADRICCLMGVHMSEVFGDDVYLTAPCDPAERTIQWRRQRDGVAA